MKNKRFLALGLFALFILACISPAAFGQEAKLANVIAQGNSVRWDVAAPHSSLTLTVVAPDGRAFRQEFKAGKSPEFTLADKEGERLPDGQYTYELRLTPVLTAGVKKTLAAERGRDDDAEAVRATRKRAVATAQVLVESGGFSILNGAAIVAGAVEEARPRPVPKLTSQPRLPDATTAALGNLRRHHLSSVAMRSTAAPDQVIPDDLIVQGSICAGFDCVNNENFGFDTIRLKENNTRIQFDDTSSAAGFPTNNWQIRANDSASGGASFLAFVDQGASSNSDTGTIVFEVDAGAPANSVRVSSTGRVGFRTATPVLDLHINTGNTPAHRLEQNNSGGFTAQTWDIAGNEANFFVRDVTSGSRLPFRIRPGAPTSSIDISADGDVGIGTASPNARLDVKQSVDSFIGGLHLRRSTTNDTWAVVTGTDNNLYMGYATDASLADASSDFTIFPLVLTTNNRVGIGTTAPDQRLSVNGDASKSGGGSWQVFSDERLKTIRGQFNSGLKAVMQLQPLRYKYQRNNALNLDSQAEHIGFGAQAVRKVIPEAVTSNDQGYLLVNNDPIIWTMLNAIKEQQAQIQRLQEEVQQLRTAKGKRRK